MNTNTKLTGTSQPPLFGPQRSASVEEMIKEMARAAGRAARRQKRIEKTPPGGLTGGAKSKMPKKAPCRAVPVKRTRARVPKNRAGKPRRRSNVEREWALERSNKPFSQTLAKIKGLRAIRKFQQSTDLVIPKTLFMELVREVMADVQGPSQAVTRIQRSALYSIQEAMEAFAVNEFETMNLIVIHAKRVTVQNKDWALLKRLRRNFTGCEIPGY
ncbi:MAG: hypothetical protein M1840_008652 [Geoglossum simile]|nr:MAG: hypothetical protein M1840_008652 [Geoglossum simile]